MSELRGCAYVEMGHFGVLGVLFIEFEGFDKILPISGRKKAKVNTTEKRLLVHGEDPVAEVGLFPIKIDDDLDVLVLGRHLLSVGVGEAGLGLPGELIALRAH